LTKTNDKKKLKKTGLHPRGGGGVEQSSYFGEDIKENRLKRSDKKNWRGPAGGLVEYLGGHSQQNGGEPTTGWAAAGVHNGKPKENPEGDRGTMRRGGEKAQL